MTSLNNSVLGGDVSVLHTSGLLHLDLHKAVLVLDQMSDSRPPRTRARTRAVISRPAFVHDRPTSKVFADLDLYQSGTSIKVSWIME